MISTDEEAHFIQHVPCQSCGSSNAGALYSDGHIFCFNCRALTTGDSSPSRHLRRAQGAGLIALGEVEELTKRHLNTETLAKWRYTVSTYDGQPVQVANYCDEAGVIVAQKIRFPGKEFKFIGDTKAAKLYGQHLWGAGGKRVVITEGEIDAMSLSQVQDNKWPVVSVPNGAQGAKKSLQKELDWLESFDEIVLLFDNDDAGQNAAKECALLFSPGKARIANLPLKDANEMLVAGRVKELIDACWKAKVYRPDGIIDGVDLWDKVSNPDAIDKTSIPYPWPSLNTLTHGLRKSELVTFTAGSGIGKSQICREVACHLLKAGKTVGYLALEESVTRTSLGILGVDLNLPLHLSKEGLTDANFKISFDRTIGSGRCFLYDHFGSLDSANLISRIRYLSKGCGCEYIILDHISIVVSGTGDGDERRLIDNLMTNLRSLVQETNISMIVVSHLKRPEGRGHEEGAEISLSQLRGSGSIAQLSDLVIGLERDQQDEQTRNILKVRVLKNRYSGETGVATQLFYNNKTGRLDETGIKDF